MYIRQELEERRICLTDIVYYLIMKMLFSFLVFNREKE